MSVGLGALVLSFLVLHSDLLSMGDQLASVISCAVAVAGMVFTASVQRRQAIDPAERRRRATEELALRIRRQWTREATERGLLHAEPLHVRWASTSRPVQTTPASIAGAGVTKLRLHGDVVGIAAAFRQLPQRKLVVIGAPEAGKSSLAVLLVNGLLDAPLAAEPVPVLLNIAGWDPAEHLDAWLVRQFAEQHPFLAREIARELVEREMVLPVLDGLDEMPATLGKDAIMALDDALGGKRPFVLTCRAEEYEALVAATGRPLLGAAVIEIAPVRAAELAAYLPSGQIDGERRWRPVIDEIGTHPDGELAQVLDSPLMVYLVRTIHSAPGRDPAELLRLGGKAAIERHLLAAYLPTVYGRRPPAPTAGSSLRDWRPSDAERWLRFLAGDVVRRNTQSIAWWELPLSPTVPSVNRLVSRVAGMATFAGTIMMGYPAASLVTAVAVVLAVSWVLPRRMVLPNRLRLRAPSMYLGIAFGILAEVVLLMLGDVWSDHGRGAIGSAFIVGFLRFANIPADPQLVTPAKSMRAEWVGLSVIVGVLSSLAIVASVFVAGWPDGLRIGLGATLELGVLTVAVDIAGTAWALFGVMCFVRSLSGELPFRLMTFLDDAHRRGVLRQVGAVYQFRHARLQAYLAGE
ncbi:hypothetical protein [Actinoplanes sp. NPDC026619]|uniref:hypothetical protein n=1 Tax=Actinoplanes sp. NPDC026619 TaxID=3155798 RepID=UPI0033C2E2C1